MKIKYKTTLEGAKAPIVLPQGDWFDLVVPEETKLHCPISETLKKSQKNKETDYYRNVVTKDKKVSLGIAMQLPKGYEAIVLPRSSTYRKWGFKLANTMGVIDNSYCGDNDIWQAHVTPNKTVTIPAGTAVLQFRIQLTQKATVWQKLNWLFWNGDIEFIKVDKLGNEDRGGDGSTDKQ